MARATPPSNHRTRQVRRGARIAARPVRGRLRGRLIWGAALLAVFAAGVGAGVLGGWGAGLFDDGAARVVLAPEAPSSQGVEEPPRQAAYDLPVDVRSSDKARRAYLDAYEEDLRDAPAPPKLPPLSPPSMEKAVAPLPGASPDMPPGASPDVPPGAPPDVPPGAPPNVPAPAPRAQEPDEAPTPALPRPAPENETAPAGPAAAPPTWLANAQPATLDPARPILAIVIDDVGVDVVHSRQAVRLPGPLTVAFLPYGFDLPAMIGTARNRGHEIMVHLPMEPKNPDADPGPNALLSDLGAEEIDRRIAWNLARIDRPVGLNNHMGSKFTAQPEGMRRVLRAVADRGLFFLDSVTSADTQGYRLAEELGVPYAVRDVFLDHTLDAATIRGQLDEALATAKRQGYAVAIGHPHEETLNVLRQWLPTVAGQGVQLVPISAVIRRRYGRG